MAAPSCRYFNGYKPCSQVDSLKTECSISCPSYQPRSQGPRVLLIHLGALGAVARSTALLPAIHRKYPGASITWITDRPADQILIGISLIDRVFTTDSKDLLKLKAFKFDVALIVDKSLEASGVLNSLAAVPEKVFGFCVDPNSGVILPATEAAQELWELGVSNKKKFYQNVKTENLLTHEALELGAYTHDEYQIHLTEAEEALARKRRDQWSEGKKKKVIGLNTGCASTIAAKKLSIDGHVELIKKIESLALSSHEKNQSVSFVLLGGKEDSSRNQVIASRVRAQGIKIVESPTTWGIRDGMTSIGACDVVISGDSFGLHLAIGLKKHTVAWFGPTCSQEIDLYGRGYKILSQATCGPCWKRECSKPVMCYDLVNFSEIAKMALFLLSRPEYDDLEICRMTNETTNESLSSKQPF